MEDKLYKFLTIYNHLPLFIRQIVGRIYNWLPRNMRYGSFYSAYLTRFKIFDRISDINALEFQQDQILFNQVNMAIHKIPFYETFERIESLDDFRRLPIIDKKIIVNSPSRFLNQKLLYKGLKTNTGGSSGTPMEFFLEKGKSRSKEKAHFDWYWGLYGFKPNDKMLMIRGLPLRNNKLFEYSSIDNILRISCYNINKQNIGLIIKRINRFRPKFIHAYPSSLKIVTSLLEEHNVKLDISIQAIFLGSEHLIGNDREYFENYFHSKVVNWYGHTERLIHGGNCPYSNEFHFYPSYGYVELLDENNQVIDQPGQEGRIIATGFDNDVMPFIRYNTGDIGIISEKKECRCGFRGLTLSKIMGRDQDVIILSDNTKVSVTAFIFGQHLDAFTKIREMQLIQEKIGEINLRIVRNSNFSEGDKESIVRTLKSSVKNKLKITISDVNTIPKTVRGKNIFFISNLK